MTNNKSGSGQRPRRVTAADVADVAGVSRSAVSRAFTEGAYIEAKKRARILKAARELGYQPNALAAGLKGRQSNLVAIFLGDMPNAYDKDVATRLAFGLNAAGKWPIMVGGSDDVARHAIENVLRYPLDAMILRSGSLAEDIAMSCTKLGVPLISSGRIMDLPGIDSICVRNADGMSAIVEVLLAGGRQRFGYIAGPRGFWSSAERRAGVITALDRAGLALQAEEHGDFSVSSGYEAARRLMERGKVDALVCANDAMAIGAMIYLREIGVSVPGDVALTGFDNIDMASWPSYGLTTVHNPIVEMVDSVTSILERRALDPGKPDEMIWLDAPLVKRSSH
jgi:DNA-binding LacI/PurR family transcriptional regulator